MEEHDYLPPSPEFLHYLWALAFMRLYPANDKALSVALGGSDPKTVHKYIWPMIESIAECRVGCNSGEFIVAYLFLVNSVPHPSYNICEQIQFENRKIGDVGNDCMLSVDGTDF